MRRDFDEYLLTVYHQKIELEKALEEATDLVKDFKITPEIREMLQEQVNTVTQNFDRLMYCKHLYSLPPKFIQKLMKKRIKNKVDSFKEKNADEQSVADENQEAIDKVNNLFDSQRVTTGEIVDE